MNVQQKRACTQGENHRKGTTRSGATAPTERDTQREQDKISILRGSQNIPPGHLDSLHKTCLKHSNFLNRKIMCTIVSTWNIMATAMGQGTEENTTS